MERFKRVGLYGISGCGKTTLAKHFANKYDTYMWIPGSKPLADLVGGDISVFQKLPEEEKIRYRKKAIQNAFKMQETRKKNIIIDGHYCFFKSPNYEVVMTDEDRKFYTDFVYMNLPAEEIFIRQENDTERKRNYTIQEIINWMNYEIEHLKNECIKFQINYFELTCTDLEESIVKLETYLL